MHTILYKTEKVQYKLFTAIEAQHFGDVDDVNIFKKCNDKL